MSKRFAIEFVYRAAGTRVLVVCFAGILFAVSSMPAQALLLMYGDVLNPPSIDAFDSRYDAGSQTPIFSVFDATGIGSPALFDINESLATPAHAIRISHGINDVLFTGGAAYNGTLSYRFYDSDDLLLGAIDLNRSVFEIFLQDVSPVLGESVVILPPFSNNDSCPSIPAPGPGVSGPRRGCVIESDTGGSSGSEEDDQHPGSNIYIDEFNLGIVSPDVPIARIEFFASIEAELGIQNIMIGASALGNFDLTGISELIAAAEDPPSAVPLPAAAWLFLSALAGLWGTARYRAPSHPLIS